MTMKTISKAGLAVTLLAGVLAGSGCVGTLDGKSTGGNPFGTDTVEARYEFPRAQVWQAAKYVLSFNGTIESEDVIKYCLEGKVDTRRVWIRVDPEDNPNMTHVYIQVRSKGAGKDVRLASELDKQIAVRLATGPASTGPGPVTTRPAAAQ